MRAFITLFYLLFALIIQAQNDIENKFTPPPGYERIYNDSYSKFLRQQPLKEKNIVRYHNGQIRFSESNRIFAAVFDYEIGRLDLHQCADAAIYLRATYNYAHKFFDRLIYTFTNGHMTSYKDYLDGAKYLSVDNGADIKKVYIKPREDNFKTFRRWLDIVWNYAGTWSVEYFDTDPVDIRGIRPGDIFVKGGFPGHAVTVVDVAVNENSEKVYMLAQSFMPAQEQHILLNPKNNTVWYKLDNSKFINTPEYVFESNQLKRFKR
tara:strand:+ start:459 stop:1250 length:792 start_codon:yes stop_codon:yes gene_type:complete